MKDNLFVERSQRTHILKQEMGHKRDCIPATASGVAQRRVRISSSSLGREL